MPAIRPGLEHPTVPTKAECRFRVPTTGPTMVGFATAANFLAATRGRPAAHKSWAYSQSGALANLYERDTNGISREHRVRWLSSTLAKHVAVWIEYQLGSTGGYAPKIEARLEVLGGATKLDDPAGTTACEWVWPHTLRAEVFPRARAAGGAVNEFPVLSCTTGVRARDLAVTPSRPRPLIVGSGAGGILDLIVTATNVRIHAITAAEMFEEVIE